KLSQREYRKASDALSPFKRILDAYLARWFLPGDLAATLPRRKGSIEQTILDFIFLPEAESFFSSVTEPEIAAAIDALKGADRKLAEAIIQIQKQRRLFHWELEFPEAFYEPRSGTNQAIERMDNPGFDAVVGNPP